jgi:hypothetical protein
MKRIDEGTYVIQQAPSSTRIRASAVGTTLLVLACSLAQTARGQAAASNLVQPVPLLSGACPVVRTNGAISLDWNPGFDHPGAVTGLKSFRLLFHPLREDGVNPNTASSILIDSGPGRKATLVDNGYFHIVARLPPSARPGVYQLAEAHYTPRLIQDYQGEEPTMTASPVGEHLCITVVRDSRSEVTIPQSDR